MQRGKQDPLNLFSGKDNDLVSLLLIGFITETEKSILENQSSGKSQKKVLETSPYDEQCNDIVSKLRKLGSALINKIDIYNFRVYKPDEEMPDDVRTYRNVSDNLAAVIVHDIMYDTNRPLALLKMERWATISRRCFYSNDYYSAASITSALRSASIEQADLFRDLTITAQQTISYFENFFLRLKNVLELEQKCLKKGMTVIPFLHVLPNLLDRVDSTPKEMMPELTSPRKEKKRIRLSYSLVKLKLKDPVDENTIKIISLLSKECLESAMDYYLYRAPSLAKEKSQVDLVSLMERLGIFGPRERYMVLLYKLQEIEKKCDDEDNLIIYNIRHILTNARLSDTKKHFAIAKILHDKSKLSKPTRQLLKEMQTILIEIDMQNHRRFNLEKSSGDIEQTEDVVKEKETDSIDKAGTPTLSDKQRSDAKEKMTIEVPLHTLTQVQSPRTVSDLKRDNYRHAQQIGIYRKSPSLTPRTPKEDNPEAGCEKTIEHFS